MIIILANSEIVSRAALSAGVSTGGKGAPI